MHEVFPDVLQQAGGACCLTHGVKSDARAQFCLVKKCNKNSKPLINQSRLCTLWLWLWMYTLQVVLIMTSSFVNKLTNEHKHFNACYMMKHFSARCMMKHCSAALVMGAFRYQWNLE